MDVIFYLTIKILPARIESMLDGKVRKTNFNVCSILVEEKAGISKNAVSTFNIYRRYPSERKKVLIKSAYFPMDIKTNGVLLINDPINKDIPYEDRKMVLEDFLKFYYASKFDMKNNINGYYNILVSIRKFVVFCLLLEIDYRECFHDGYIYPCNLTENEFLQILYRFFKKDQKIISSNKKIEFNLVSDRLPNSKTLYNRFKHIDSFLRSLKVYSDDELYKVGMLVNKNLQGVSKSNQISNGSDKYLTEKELQLISAEIESYKVDIVDNLKMINPLHTDIPNDERVKAKKYFDTKLLFVIMLCCGFRVGTTLALTREDVKYFCINQSTGEYAYVLLPRDRIGNPHDSRVKNAPKPLSTIDYESKAYRNNVYKCSSVFVPERLYRFILDYILFLDKYYNFRLKRSRRKKDLIENYKSLIVDCVEEHDRPFDNKFLFVSNNFTKMSADTARKYFIDIFKKVGIVVDVNSKRKNNLLHRFRHSRMKISLNNGIIYSSDDFIRALGNSSISGSKAYFHPEDVENCKRYVEILEKDDIFKE